MNRLPFEDRHREAGLENFSLLSVRLGRSSRTLHRWKNNGVPIRDADDVAIRLGSHPDYIWPHRGTPSPVHPRRTASVMTSTNSYRLHDRRRTICRGPLALVAGQAHRAARADRPLVISDTAGNSVTVSRHRGTIWPTWQQPQELFPAPAVANQPDWYCRLLALIVNLNDDHEPAIELSLPPARNEQHNTNPKEQQ